jgi:hypothetical protein
MSTPYLRWILSACWISIVAVVFLALGASSSRSWLYVATVALGPPMVLVRLWPQRQPQSISDVMHGRGDRS